MGKINLKHIGKFEDFCKSRKTRRIKEANELSIDVPFWQDAIDAVLQDIRQISGDPIDWSLLLSNLKVKFLVIGRDLPTGEDIVLAHIRDILFQRFGDTILGGDIGCLTYDAGEMGAFLGVLKGSEYRLSGLVDDAIAFEIGGILRPRS